MAQKSKSLDLIKIEVEEEVDDILQRMALLHAAFVRVLINTRLVEVLEADYEKGEIKMVIESKRYHPRIQGKVCVHYEPCPAIECDEGKTTHSVKSDTDVRITDSDVQITDSDVKITEKGLTS